MRKPLALTLGEPAGIGPDITIKAWLHRKELKLPAFYLLGDCEVISRRAVNDPTRLVAHLWSST